MMTPLPPQDSRGERREGGQRGRGMVASGCRTHGQNSSPYPRARCRRVDGLAGRAAAPRRRPRSRPRGRVRYG